MEGVQEQHLVGMAAGLALSGKVPYFNTIATFITRRCYEQILMDLCMHDLPVRLIGNGGVHASQRHLEALIDWAKTEKIPAQYIKQIFKLKLIRSLMVYNHFLQSFFHSTNSKK